MLSVKLIKVETQHCHNPLHPSLSPSLPLHHHHNVETAPLSLSPPSHSALCYALSLSPSLSLLSFQRGAHSDRCNAAVEG